MVGCVGIMFGLEGKRAGLAGVELNRRLRRLNGETAPGTHVERLGGL